MTGRLQMGVNVAAHTRHVFLGSESPPGRFLAVRKFSYSDSHSTSFVASFFSLFIYLFIYFLCFILFLGMLEKNVNPLQNEPMIE